MEPKLNQQPTKELNQFQKLIVQDFYIKKLNWWLDEARWECEKRDTIIEMRDKEIEELQLTILGKEKQIADLKLEYDKLNKKYESVSSKGGKLLIRKGIFPK